MKRFLVVFFAGCCLCSIPALADQLPLLGLAQVNIRVSNLDEARAFYSGVAGFDEVFDARNPDGSVAAAYFKVNDQQFLEIVPGLKANEARPMAGFAFRTNQIDKLRSMLTARGLTPGKIQNYPDGSTGFTLTNLPGQDLDFVEFVEYGPHSLAAQTKGKDLGAHRLAMNLEHVGIIATNFGAAYSFYVETLGFHEVWRRMNTNGSRVVIDHIQMQGADSDFIELSNQTERSTPLARKSAGGAAHFALTVPDINAVVSAVNARNTSSVNPPRYGLDNRWNFNLYDSDGTRVEFMQAADPAHPAPAVVVTPPNFGQAAHDLGIFEGQSDIGNPSLAGSAIFDPAENQYTVSGAGANIFARNDEFHFVWRRVSNDFSLTATIRFLKQEPPTDRKVALMARQSLDSDAPYVDAVVHGRGLTVLQFREATGDLTHTVRFPINAPVRIRLERKKGWFTMYAATEGQPLQELGEYELKLTDPTYLGLAVCSHNASTVETAIFSDVQYEAFQEEPRIGKKE